MRAAIAEAEVGDDVFGEDPTVNRLQERVAELLGKEAALFVPSGCMANQIAIKVLTRPGQEILVGDRAHTWLFETGAAAAISGVQNTIIGSGGMFTADDVRAAYKPDNHHFAPTRVVSVENTHNMGGGRVWDRERVAEILACADELGIHAHLDGARLWNAAAAQGVSEAELAAGFTTVSVCLSKGLGAPVGSIFASTRELVHEGHRYRKMLGGGMRQAGILAAAGLYALEHNRPRLGEDHENARYLANSLAAIDGLTVDVDTVDTNIVMVDLDPRLGTAAALEGRARELDLAFVCTGPQRVRLVTHHDVDRAACTRAVEIFAELAA
jgi:threonine aldolase